ncbi:MAG: hypothetical protein D6731_24495 [Planctomycetota bacterium]|nr:MAG: hypothetical protein D6731_24495 [Planctomycetota bacterium]
MSCVYCEPRSRMRIVSCAMEAPPGRRIVAGPSLRVTLATARGAMFEGALIAGRYRIERQIGRGGTGRVYAATDTKFDMGVALKIATPPELDYDEFLGRFKREAKIGRLLGRRSSRFVRALDWGEYGGDSLYLVMDLVEGARDLDLKNGSLEDRIARLARAAELVREVHALGIVHRDVKPANFLVSVHGRIHLADFGLAKVMNEAASEWPSLSGSVTQSGFAMGTPYYMAPEQVDAKAVDARADVYALGVMLFLALTGELPYEGNIGELLIAHQIVRNGDAPPPNPLERVPDLPEELAELCLRAMHLDVEQRLQSVEELLDGLRPGGSRPPHTTPLDLNRLLGESKLQLAADAEEAARPPARRATPPEPAELVRRGERLVNRRDGSELLYVPAGSFNPFPDEEDADPEGTRPLQRVSAYWIGRHPVTWGQFRAFCAATGREPPQPSYPVTDDHPVHGVSFGDAWDYCAWAGVRLPTEAEWEFAARGGDDERAYPWGDEPPDPTRCNWRGHPDYGTLGTSPVGSFPAGASPFGVEDLGGNVLEWTADPEDPLPTEAPPPQLPQRTLRGGAYRLDESYCEIRTRTHLSPDSREPDVGFRVALDAAAVGDPPGGESPAAPPREEPAGDGATTDFEAVGALDDVLDEIAPDLDPVGEILGTAPAAPSRTRRSPPPLPRRRRTARTLRQPGSGPTPRGLPRPAPPPAAVPRAEVSPRASPAGARSSAPLPPELESDLADLPPAPAKEPARPPARVRRRTAPAEAEREREEALAARVGPDPRKRIFRRTTTVLRDVGEAVARKREEIKFIYGESRVALSFLLEERGRWGFLEQRVTLDRQKLAGKPTGFLNLLRAVNTANLRCHGIRALVSADRLRFRRELFLQREETLTPQEIEAHCEALLQSWADLFQPLREVQAGAPGEEVLRDLQGIPPSEPERVAALRELLTGADLHLEPLSGDRLGVGKRPRQIVLSASGEEVHAWLLLRAWEAPPHELEALRLGERAPQVEELLLEINQKNRGSLYSLAWDPQRGVVGRAVLSEADASLTRLLAFLDALDQERAREVFLCLGDVDERTR